MERLSFVGEISSQITGLHVPVVPLRVTSTGPVHQGLHEADLYADVRWLNNATFAKGLPSEACSDLTWTESGKGLPSSVKSYC